LAIDTSSKSCSVCVADDKKIVAELVIDNKLTHSRTLFWSPVRFFAMPASQ
jgi:tRNA A37 threonylcarbamoyladenosine modification protein TsaB